jgi:hypothetical protein
MAVKRLILGELNKKIAAIKKLDTKHAPVVWYETNFADGAGSDGWECPKCRKADYRLEKELCTPDWEKNISAAWGLVAEAIRAGLDFSLDHELNREWSDVDDYYDCWKCFFTRWEDKTKGITFATWNNAINKEDEVWDKTHTELTAICTTWIAWKEATNGS